MELKNERFDKETNEYVYDVELTDKEKETWGKLAKENNMEIGEYMSYCLKEFVEKNAHIIEQGDNRR